MIKALPVGVKVRRIQHLHLSVTRRHLADIHCSPTLLPMASPLMLTLLEFRLAQRDNRTFTANLRRVRASTDYAKSPLTMLTARSGEKDIVGAL